MNSSDRARLIKEFQIAISRAETWLHKYSGQSGLSCPEAKTVDSLLRYIASARKHCFDPKMRPQKLQRARMKIEATCWALYRKWTQSGRHIS
jgi:hypothetical protein